MVPAPANGTNGDDERRSERADAAERRNDDVAPGNFPRPSVPVENVIDRRSVEELRTTVQDFRLWLDYWDDLWEKRAQERETRARERRSLALSGSWLVLAVSSTLTLATSTFHDFSFGSAEAWRIFFIGLVWVSLTLGLMFAWSGIVKAGGAAVKRWWNKKRRSKAPPNDAARYVRPETREDLVEAIRKRLSPPY